MDSSPIRVLLIEDSLVQVALIRNMLKQSFNSDFSLECCDRLSTGLERLAKGAIDVVLLDLILPDSEGLETFLRVHKMDGRVPVVVLTGLDDRLLAVTAMQEGAEDYLVKSQVDGLGLARSLRYAVERNRRREMEVQLDAANHEFRAARAIQQKLIPTVPQLSSFDIGGMSYCAVGTCGDYFDYIRMLGNCVGIVVADVSGHGLGPSLLMATTRAYMRALTRVHTDVGEILTIVNRALVEDTQSEHFVTMVLACLDPHSRSFVYTSAGHPPGYVLDASGAVKATLNSTGFPLGVVPEAEYHTGLQMTLEPGDVVVLFSDGILEANSPEQVMFGTNRALDIVRLCLQEPAIQIVDNLYHAVRAYSQDLPQADDITAVIVKIGPQSTDE